MNFDVELFNKTYRGTRWFSEESKYFTEFLKDIQNAELMSHLRFCNDFLQIPPIFAYVRFRRDLYTGVLEKKEKLALGACFGFLFQYGEYAALYGPNSAHSVWVGDKVTGIKNASYFTRRD